MPESGKALHPSSSTRLAAEPDRQLPLTDMPTCLIAAPGDDEVVLHVRPVLLGRGIPLFGAGRASLRCIETIHGEGAVHLRYEVQ